VNVELLDLGIRSDDGTCWLPKAIYSTRSEAKMFAVEYLDSIYIEVRVRTRWMRQEPENDPEMEFEVCDRDHPNAFECWEIT
jgi:hypothetical protein